MRRSLLFVVNTLCNFHLHLIWKFSKFTEKEGVQKIRLQGLDLFAGNDQSRNDLSLIVGIEHEKPGVFCGQKESHPGFPPLLSGHSVALVHLVKWCYLILAHWLPFMVVSLDMPTTRTSWISIESKWYFLLWVYQNPGPQATSWGSCYPGLANSCETNLPKNQQSECSAAPLGSPWLPSPWPQGTLPPSTVWYRRILSGKNTQMATRSTSFHHFTKWKLLNRRPRQGPIWRPS